MSLLDSFSPHECYTLEVSLVWIFEAVARADGRRDLKEWDAMSYVHRKAKNFDNDLAREVLLKMFDEMESVNDRFLDDPRDVKEGFKEVSEIIDAKVDKELALGFKKSILAVGYYIANASGDPGAKICNEEAEALDTIRKNLGISEEALRTSPTINDIVAKLMKE